MDVKIKRALLSVSDKTGLIEFAHDLHQAGIELYSTGGTSKALSVANIPHQQVEDLTHFPEIFAGRVKTLHPKIYGGILGRRDEDEKEAERHAIDWIDLVVVNFYPFETSVHAQMKIADAIEYIDIGGPTMVRAAAKNFAWVGVVIDPNDYMQVSAAIKTEGTLSLNLRRTLATKVFAYTSRYDAAIQKYFSGKVEPQPELELQFSQHAILRYGENPHQKAFAYQIKSEQTGLFAAKQHQGKTLSFNNLLDAEAAYRAVSEFTEPACVIVKHANPCGAATAENLFDAYQNAFNADPISAFGGIVALNQTCDAEIAALITQHFTEVVIAAGYTLDALNIFASKPNLRVLSLPPTQQNNWELKFITGGVLMQEHDAHRLKDTDLKVVTTKIPTEADINTMLFAWRILKHIKSNGILLAKNNATVGIGAGQVSRIDAVSLAVQKAKTNIKDTILASDAFFPFRDSIDHIAKTGVRAIIQPGGSVRDAEVIAACNEQGIAMVFTGMRCFRH